jgi:hypothetical protein
VVVPGCGHYPAEEAPEAVLAALGPFLAPYRDAHRSADRASGRSADRASGRDAAG